MITDEQTELVLSRVDEVRDKWIAIGLSCEPINKRVANKAIHKLYEVAGLAKPKILWAQSPLSGARKAAQLRHGRKRVSSSEVRQELSNACYGQHDVHSLAQLDAFTGVIDEVEEARPLMDVASSVGWFYPYDTVCICTERPQLVKLDDEGLLHCEDGPAVRYSDGLSVYSWHGTSIPAEWIEDGISAKDALGCDNLEQRRCACEIVGWHNILAELDATTIDEDHPRIGKLVEVDLPDSGRERFLVVECGTGRTFALPVAPDVASAYDANLSTYPQLGALGLPKNLIRSAMVSART